ncbi:hypothetical protein BC939DRAFT_481704 [Gamsiella multidivaricata]|uniref:uncharacterized protein n=1 Tax=Gamsiella multidivaricata TaxID=101098 RepID=UPI00221E6172|nr:uncharacterized protein BC939DRAFT_481704 [Gamsiella multidivaricata]KAI7816794.1 hypothetical protein BC939DRAFT_481704 [Gamsiella multidivaricata]
MDNGQQAYLDRADGKDIGIIGFVRNSTVVLEAADFDKLWRSIVMPYLLNHNSKNKVDNGMRLRKAVKEKRLEKFENAIKFHEHTEVLLPGVSEQARATSNVYTEQYAAFVASEIVSRVISSIATATLQFSSTVCIVFHIKRIIAGIAHDYDMSSDHGTSSE